MEDTNEIPKLPDDDVSPEIKDFLREVLTNDEAEKKAERLTQVKLMAVMIANHPDEYSTEEEIEYAISIAAKNDHERRVMEDIIEELTRNRKL